MKPLLRPHLSLTALLAFLFCLPLGSAFAESAATIDSKSRTALAELYNSNIQARDLGHKAVAVLVFPHIVKAGFIFSAFHGEGALIEGKKTAGYYNTASTGFGLEAGIQQYSYALFFMDKPALDHLNKHEGWELGSDPTVVIANKGKTISGTSTHIKGGTAAVFFEHKGLMAGASMRGTKITQIQPK